MTVLRASVLVLTICTSFGCGDSKPPVTAANANDTAVAIKPPQANTAAASDPQAKTPADAPDAALLAIANEFFDVLDHFIALAEAANGDCDKMLGSIKNDEPASTTKLEKITVKADAWRKSHRGANFTKSWKQAVKKSDEHMARYKRTWRRFFEVTEGAPNCRKSRFALLGAGAAVFGEDFMKPDHSKPQ